METAGQTVFSDVFAERNAAHDAGREPAAQALLAMISPDEMDVDDIEHDTIEEEFGEVGKGDFH